MMVVYEDTEILVTNAQSGDTRAFDELVTRFEGRVFAIVMQRLRNTAEADEVVQEVFLRAFRKLSQLQEPAAFPGWISRIANRLAINRAVRRPPEVPCEPGAFDGLDHRISAPESGMLMLEDAEQLRDGISRLREMDRRTLMAFYFEGQSLKEMAESFSSPVGTIKRRLHTARNRLRDELVAMQPA